MTDFLNALRKFIETVAPALAIMLFDYEEGKADAAIKKKEAAELALKNVENEKTIRDHFDGKSDNAIIDDILSTVAESNAGKSVPPKPGSGS